MTTTETTHEWELWNAQELASMLDGLTIPAAEELAKVQPGDIVKLVFGLVNPETEIAAERMWVMVNGLDAAGFTGTLDTDPEVITSLQAGDEISFDSSHIIEIFDEEAYQNGSGGCGGNCNCNCGN
ncbi:DUF2314 domain-containing protein [Arcanobacterium phocisimile]|uniref:DUF2314 domain-containing protein n=1 Tax=Arcanobacterium phocisimile TaxID=1302235 RepID=A0ABX7IFS7_9ACTO|nr:DUF2314 domain-containing protein [Arcanobacterium phocisimile]QRV01993.1 DUF2314 domain-containing protein [Arcanobacterium phocisimile]